MASPWQIGRDKPNNFDLLRLLFSILVVYCHSISALYGEAAQAGVRDIVSWMSAGQISSGELAVDAFFSISGFLILHSWFGSKSVWEYLVKRSSRIYPGFLAAVLFCTFIVAPLAEPSARDFLRRVNVNDWLSGASLLSLVLPPVFLNNPQPGYSNVSLWTIPYEFQCYLLVLALGVLGLYHRRRVVGLLWLVALTAYVLSPGEAWPRFLCYFLSGATFYLCRTAIPRRRRLMMVSALVLGIVAVAGHGLLHAALPIFGVYTLFYVAFWEMPALARLSRHGDFSYGVYLYAFPIQQLLVMWLPGRFNVSSLFVLAALLTAAPAVCSWHLIEKPCLRTKRHAGMDRKDNRFLQTASRPFGWVIAIFGLAAFTHTFGGMKLQRIATHLMHHPAPIWLVSVVDFGFGLWTIWGAVSIYQEIAPPRPFVGGNQGPDTPCLAASEEVSGRDTKAVLHKFLLRLPFVYALTLFGAEALLHLSRSIASVLNHALH